MESSIVTELLQHGLLGIAVIVLALVVRALYKRTQEVADEREKLHAHYQKQLKDAYELHAAKAEEWAAKGQEVAVKLENLVGAMLQKGGGE